MLKRPGLAVHAACIGVIVAAMAVIYLRIPSGFLPDEDQGQMLTIVQVSAPPGATQRAAPTPSSTQVGQPLPATTKRTR